MEPHEVSLGHARACSSRAKTLCSNATLRAALGTRAFMIAKHRTLGMTQRQSPGPQTSTLPLKTVSLREVSLMESLFCAASEYSLIADICSRHRTSLYGASEEGTAPGPMAVAMPSQSYSGVDWLHLMDPKCPSVSSKHHDQELLRELFDHDIRSKPTVKFPPLLHGSPQQVPSDIYLWPQGQC